MTPFDIVLVPFPFSDLSTTKQRPCVVLASYRPRSLPEHLVVAMMTSQVRKPHFPFDIVLQDWQAASLPLPTLVRLGKVVTLDANLIHKKLGKLGAADTRSIKQGFRKLFKSLMQ